MNKIFATIIGVSLLLLFILVFNMNKTKTMPKTNNFVTADNQNLYLQGKQFRSVGVNRYNLLTYNVNGSPVGCANPFSEEEIEAMFSQLHSMGVTSIRFWLFQSFTQSGTDTSRFDYVLKEAAKYNIKVIPVFENHWTDCSEGGEKTSDWYASGYEAPYGNYPLSLKNYIAKIVPKYKDNPTILTWEIMNEATSTDYAGLYKFANDISGYVKSLDSNHLVSLSLNSTKESTSDIQGLSSIKTIDILDYHDYDNESVALPETLQESLTIAKNNAKPLVVGESGIKDTVENRAVLMDAKMQAFFDNGGAMYLIWGYGESYITNDGFNFSSSSPLAQTVQQTAAEINQEGVKLE